MAYLDRFEVHDQDYIAQMRVKFLELNSDARRRYFTRSKALRIFSIAALSASLYGISTLYSSDPVCTSGTPVEVTNPSSRALRGEFTSAGCDTKGGKRLVILSKGTGEQYGASIDNVRPITP